MDNLAKAVRFREYGKVDEALKIVLNLLKEDPDDSCLNYQCACCYDLLGEEVLSTGYYEKAIENKLEGDDLEGAYLGLGSTYRFVGKYEESKKLLEEAILKFPDNLEFEVFYGMTLYNLKKYEKAMEIMLRIIAETSSNENIKKCKAAILYYSNKLD